MAAPYALPSSALPHAHHQHLHSHSRSPSSLSAWRASMSREPLPVHFEDDAHGHDRAQSHSRSHSRGHSHNRMSSQASNTSATLMRDKPAPAALDTLDGWSQEKTAGGKFVLTPGPGALTTPYSPPRQHHHHNHNDHHSPRQCNHHGAAHAHPGDDQKSRPSLFTRALLPYAARFPLLHAILVEKDSRRIFYFMALNFCFMVVQAVYGYLTDSLGLLSDSIHMFFDCVALLVGLLAAVMSKWPPSQRFPYGFGKIETLSGFANGILLMLLSVEIAFEALERLWEGQRTKRLGELFIVSSLGLAVNLVGMMAFGHHHHGHDHGHSHGHGHDKSSNDNSPSAQSHSGHSHGHCHDNDNMRGIYLHVLADTLGSVSVIVSTALTSLWGWSGWDPLASCFIAVLIFLSSQPLVLSSARRLLLSVPEDSEYNLRSSLGGILQQRGVVSYTVPKLWLDDRTGGDANSRLVGVVHITVARGASMDDARNRVQEYLLREGIDVVVQVEREGDECWCAKTRTPATPRAPKPF
ncbi:cation efflux family protein [Hirsutella rhossiliensis]|uniref:Zinc transporter n=1 Tax=Hirsutella rhossiliensis TaxID=111463 RepID=A0A9P8MZX0_9HYPO|nr:cation efflux family domain-containing protein [Hirsutella rhossiliensis]KAH0965558.1 cation efflux family domain-containing protein [Hirsutella rhossiliensis]